MPWLWWSGAPYPDTQQTRRCVGALLCEYSKLSRGEAPCAVCVIFDEHNSANYRRRYRRYLDDKLDSPHYFRCCKSTLHSLRQMINDLLFARVVVPTFGYVLFDRCCGLNGLFERKSGIHRNSVVPFLPLKLRSSAAGQKKANLSKLSAFIQCVDNSNTVAAPFLTASAT